MILKHVKQTITLRHLFQQGQHVLVGVSGGADSMALLLILRDLAPDLGIRLTAAHFNHRIRGLSADEDERFVKTFAGQLGIDFIRGSTDVKRLARSKGQSLEMAGREARYAFFAESALERHCDLVATAHTADDQAETILLKLSRGSGMQGLCGIPYVTYWKNVKIVRPLRDIDRKSIIQFLERKHVTWRKDASNDDTAFLRNRVRHEVLPYLESKLNPQFRQALSRLSSILEPENEWLDALAIQILSECKIGTKPAAASEQIHTAIGLPEKGLLCEPLSRYPLAARRRVLRLWLVSCGLPPETLDFEDTDRLNSLLSSGRKNRAVTLAGGWIVRRQYDRLIIKKQGDETILPFRVPLNIPGETLLAEQGFRIVASLEPGLFQEKPRGIGSFPARASLNTTTWRRRRITVRSWHPGDRISPLGLKGSKKIQDVFTDMKVPKEWRHRVPLFECHNQIIWVPGYRIARGWDISDSSVRAIQLCIERI